MPRLFLILAIVFSTGCLYETQSTINKPFDGAKVFNTEDNIKISIIPSADLTNYKISKQLTTFYLEIFNNSDKKIYFDSNDMVLIDDSGLQYNQLSPENAANIVRESSRKWYIPRISIGIGGGYHSKHFHFSGHNYFWPHRIYYPYRRYHYHDSYYPYNQYQYDLSEIYSSAIIPGSVKPGSTLKGFIYFKKVPKEARNIQLDISYKNDGSSKTKTITFELTRN